MVQGDLHRNKNGCQAPDGFVMQCNGNSRTQINSYNLITQFVSALFLEFTQAKTVWLINFAIIFFLYLEKENSFEPLTEDSIFLLNRGLHRLWIRLNRKHAFHIKTPVEHHGTSCVSINLHEKLLSFLGRIKAGAFHRFTKQAQD